MPACSPAQLAHRRERTRRSSPNSHGASWYVLLQSSGRCVPTAGRNLPISTPVPPSGRDVRYVLLRRPVPLGVVNDYIIRVGIDVLRHRDRQLPETGAVEARPRVQAAELFEIIHDRAVLGEREAFRQRLALIMESLQLGVQLLRA